MFNKMKYIIIDNECGGERPYIFSGLDQHYIVAGMLKGQNDTIVGAGFVSHTATGLQCWGESTSLKIKSRPEDTQIINRFFGVVNP